MRDWFKRSEWPIEPEAVLCITYNLGVSLADKKTNNMNTIEQQNEFRGWKVLPARLTVSQTAWFLGFKPHDIPVLTAAGLLKPLGHPARNCIKHYATGNLEALRGDEKWLARASDTISSHWREKNARKQEARGRGEGNMEFNQQSVPNGQSAGSPMKCLATE